MSIETKVFNAAVKLGMPPKLAELITAQSKHESGNYRSNVFLKNNNLYGYKFVGQSNATKGTPAPANEGAGGAYAKYDTIEDSVKELVNWIKRRQREKKFPTDLSLVNTPELYAGLLKAAGYYGAPITEYITGLKRYFKEFPGGAAGAGISTAILCVIGAAAYLIFRK